MSDIFLKNISFHFGLEIKLYEYIQRLFYC